MKLPTLFKRNQFIFNLTGLRCLPPLFVSPKSQLIFIVLCCVTQLMKSYCLHFWHGRTFFNSCYYFWCGQLFNFLCLVLLIVLSSKNSIFFLGFFGIQDSGRSLMRDTVESSISIKIYTWLKKGSKSHELGRFCIVDVKLCT